MGGRSRVNLSLIECLSPRPEISAPLVLPIARRHSWRWRAGRGCDDGAGMASDADVVVVRTIAGKRMRSQPRMRCEVVQSSLEVARYPSARDFSEDHDVQLDQVRTAAVVYVCRPDSRQREPFHVGGEGRLCTLRSA